MFVSSYNTYIQTNTSSKSEKQRIEDAKSEVSFSSKLLRQPKQELSSFESVPVDYLLKGKSFKNKLEAQKQTQEFQDLESSELNRQDKITKTLTSQQTMQNAKIAYKDNSKIFSLMRKPLTTLDQTPKIDSKLPKNIQELKEKNMKMVMVNTYIQNDKYYKITA